MLEGRLLEAEEAAALGLVHRVFEADRLLPETLGYAEVLASRSPAAVRGIKRCVWEGGAMDIASGLRVETEEFLATMETEWARERLRQAADAYRAGSPPAW